MDYLNTFAIRLTAECAKQTKIAWVAELVDAHDSNSCSARSAGSIPASGTLTPVNHLIIRGLLFLGVQFGVQTFFKYLFWAGWNLAKCL